MCLSLTRTRVRYYDDPYAVVPIHSLSLDSEMIVGSIGSIEFRGATELSRCRLSCGFGLFRLMRALLSVITPLCTPANTTVVRSGLPFWHCGGEGHDSCSASGSGRSCCWWRDLRAFCEWPAGSVLRRISLQAPRELRGLRGWCHAPTWQWVLRLMFCVRWLTLGRIMGRPLLSGTRFPGHDYDNLSQHTAQPSR
jgi:hypothetical protein